MPLESINNSRWGFESNCFVCDSSNPHGLGIPFFLDTDRQVVQASFNLDDAHSGAPSYLHGGIVLAILDEAMAWATIAVCGMWALTAETSARFRRPVSVGVEYRVEAGLTREDDKNLHMWGVVLDAEGERCTVAEARFVALSPAEAVNATGAELSAENQRFAR